MVYAYYEIGKEMVEAEQREERTIFRSSGFANSLSKINAGEIKLMTSDTRIKVI